MVSNGVKWPVFETRVTANFVTFVSQHLHPQLFQRIAIGIKTDNSHKTFRTLPSTFEELLNTASIVIFIFLFSDSRFLCELPILAQYLISFSWS